MAGPSRISVVSVLSLFYVAFVEDGSAKAKFRYEGRSSGDRLLRYDTAPGARRSRAAGASRALATWTSAF